MALPDLSLTEQSLALRENRVSAVELVDAHLERIKRVNGGPPTVDGAPNAINGWVRLYPHEARRAAEAADRARAASPDGHVLCGVPIALKDVFGVRGLGVTASSDVLTGNIATESCEPWRRLAARDAVLLGHAHTHEFAAGSLTPQCGNPWDTTRTVGGSSGGSAAVLAARMAPGALGTDTAGSLRIPAALCGIAALKPTRGRVPITGVLELARSLDHVGPMARSVADCAVLYEALATDGPDQFGLSMPGRPFSDDPTPTPGTGSRPLAGRLVATTNRIDESQLDADVAEGLAAAERALVDLGATVVRLEAPTGRADSDVALASTGAAMQILMAEMAAYHEQWSTQPDAYLQDIREVLKMARGMDIDVAKYIAAQALRDQVTTAWDDWMASHGIDAILEPTTPITAPLRPARGEQIRSATSLAMFTILWDLTGQPVVAQPVGLGERSGLPVGISLVGRRGGEATILQMGMDLETHALPPLPPPPGVRP